MGPKQRKSLSSFSTSCTNSPWKPLTRLELYGVIDSCDISVSSDKLLKAELIEILEKNLDDFECKKWLEYYNKPLPYPEFGKPNIELSTTVNISDTQPYVKNGRKSVPAYLAVANYNSVSLDLDSNSSFKDNLQDRDFRKRRNSISACMEQHNQNFIDLKDERKVDKQSKKNVLFSSISSEQVLSNTNQQDNRTNLDSKFNFSKTLNAVKTTQDNKKNEAFSLFSMLKKTSNISTKFNCINYSRLIIFIVLVSSLIFFYNYFHFFIQEPKFCDSIAISTKNDVKYSCVKCPSNGYCKEGILVCNPQYKKTVKYFGGKWQIVCIYDDEAYDLAEEMLAYISNKLRKLRGNKICNNTNIFGFLKNNSGNHNYNFGSSFMLSESEINDLIHLSFNYIDTVLIQNALSIMWNSIKNGNSLSRYRLNLLSNTSYNVSSQLSNQSNITNNYLDNSIFIEALDFEISISCRIKLFFWKWITFFILTILIILPIYLYYSIRKRKKIIMNKIKEIIYRENRKDTNTGLFIGPDAVTILRLLRLELPQYTRIFNEQLIVNYCNELEQKDPNIQKTLLSENKLPFYWASK